MLTARKDNSIILYDEENCYKLVLSYKSKLYVVLKLFKVVQGVNDLLKSYKIYRRRELGIYILPEIKVVYRKYDGRAACLGFDAPRYIQIVRSNAIRKTKQL